MTRWAKRVAVAIVGICGPVVMGGCGSGVKDRVAPETVDQSSEEALPPADILNCGTQTLTRDDGSTETVDEWYVPRAMNAKLRLYPDFAVAAKMTSAWNCDEARTLFDAYSAYSRQHPGFDADQPLEAPSMAPPMPPLVQDTRMDRRIPKQSGRGRRLGKNPAIVQLRVDDGRGPGGTQGGQTMPGTGGIAVGICTGTFITKNWVATAAHCLMSVKGIARSPDGGVTFKSNPAWGWWGFQPADDSGNNDRSRYFECQHTLGIADSRYMGFRAGEAVASAYDFALLYVLPECDDKMPVNPDGTPAVMAVATNNDLIGATLDERWWGFGVHEQDPGDPTTTDPANGQQLSSGPTADFANAAGHVYPDFVKERADHQLVGWVPEFDANGLVFSGPYACDGDSGGPIVDSVDINQGGLVAGRDVVSAVLSFTGQRIKGAPCAKTPNSDYVVWSPISESAKFIRTQMRRWQIVHEVPTTGTNNATSACLDWSVVGQPSAGVMVCQGDPCVDTDECCMNSANYPFGHGSHNCEVGAGTTRWYCQHPGAQLDDEGGACRATGTADAPGAPLCPSGGCDCIKGQCLPLPAEAR